jgi:hypothetical protein
MKYQKLSFNYDRELLLKEIFQHSNNFVDIPAAKEYLAYRPFDIVDKRMYDNVTTVSKLGVQPGTISSWKGYSFTYVPIDPMSTYGGNFFKLKHEIWQWKKHSNCPYIQSLTEQLGFVQIQNVRSMVIEPPGFGPVHCDIPEDSDYYNNHISITFNIENGGVPLIAMINESLVECDDPCFIFQDNCWHGVGIVKSRRTQLRINGVIDYQRFSQFIDK